MLAMPTEIDLSFVQTSGELEITFNKGVDAGFESSSPCKSSSMAIDNWEICISSVLKPNVVSNAFGFEIPAASHISTITEHGTAVDSAGHLSNQRKLFE